MEKESKSIPRAISYNEIGPLMHNKQQVKKDNKKRAITMISPFSIFLVFVLSNFNSFLTK